MTIALDTSFLVDLLRGDSAAKQQLDTLAALREATAIPAPALYELLSGVLVHRGPTGARRVEGALGRFPVLPLDRDSAQRAAEVRAELVAMGREKPHIDVLIAGVALRFGASLLSRDSDFRAISEATGLVVKSY